MTGSIQIGATYKRIGTSLRAKVAEVEMRGGIKWITLVNGKKRWVVSENVLETSWMKQ